MIVQNLSLEWDGNPSTIQLENRESIHGISSLGNKTIPIVSTEESSLSVDSFNTPSREFPVERRVLLFEMDQREMIHEMSTLKGKIAELEAFMLVNRMDRIDAAQMEEVIGELNKGYAKIAGEVEAWKRKYAEIRDNDICEEVKQDLQRALNSLFTYQDQIGTRRAELAAIAPQATVPQPVSQEAQGHPGLDSYVQRKHRGEMTALARHIKEAALRVLGSCRADEKETRWCYATDRVIRVAMKKMDTWEAMMENLQQEFTKYEGLVMVNAEHEIRDDESEDSDAETEYSQVRRLVGRAAERVEETRKDVEHEDEERKLYSLQDRPVSLMEYPKFNGKDTQCFYTF